MKQMIRCILMGFNLAFAIGSLVLLVFVPSESDVWPLAFFGGVLVYIGTFIFLRPYEKWLFDKPGKFANGLLIAMWIGGVSVWVLCALTIGWATPQKFAAAICLLMSTSSLVYLSALKRVRAYVS